MITDITTEQILAANVDNKPTNNEDQEIEEKLRSIAKQTTFTMKLTIAEVDFLQRQSSILDVDWKTFFTSQIRAKVLNRDGAIGQALITGPSFAAKMIKGPSYGK